MTVTEFLNRLQRLQEVGFGENQVTTYDPDTEQYEPVTGFTYGGTDEQVMLYTDEP